MARDRVGGALVALLESRVRRPPRRRLPALPARALGLLAGAGRLAGAARCGGAGSSDAETALLLWQGEEGEPPRDLLRLREAAERSPAALAAEVGRWRRRWRRGRCATTRTGRALRPGDGLELRAAGGDRRRARRAGRAGRRWRRGPRSWRATIAALDFRVWSGPVEGRVRIASPYRLRAGRFDHVFVGSLQDGEFPRRDRGGDPFLSERAAGDARARPAPRHRGRGALPLPRLPRPPPPQPLPLLPRQRRGRRRQARSPLLDDVRALLAPAPDGTAPDPVEEAITVTPRPGAGRRAAGRGALGGRAGAGARRPRPRRRRAGPAGRGRGRRTSWRRGSPPGSPPPAAPRRPRARRGR